MTDTYKEDKVDMLYIIPFYRNYHINLQENNKNTSSCLTRENDIGISKKIINV